VLYGPFLSVGVLKKTREGGNRLVNMRLAFFFFFSFVEGDALFPTGLENCKTQKLLKKTQEKSTDKSHPKKIALFFPGIPAGPLERMPPLIFNKCNQKLLNLYPPQFLSFLNSEEIEKSNITIERKQNSLNVRSIAIFRVLKKNKMPYDVIYAQSCGLFPALYASKSLSLKDEVDFSWKRAKIIQNVCNDIKNKFGKTDMLVINGQDVNLRFETVSSKGIYLVAKHAYDLRVYACLAKPLQKFLKVISDFHFIVLKDQPPLNCILMFSAIDGIEKALMKKNPKTPKVMLISDVEGKEVLNKADIQNISRVQIISQINTVKACKTLNKHGVTDVIIIGRDLENKHIMEGNLFGVRVHTVSTEEDIQKVYASIK
jgi:malonyl CoA-acyl carrier protein transacylase